MATAAEYGLDLKPVSGRPDECRANCPFCEKGDRRRHLYINATKQVFNCYKCGRNGGVLTFLALLEGRSETAVLEDLREKLPAKKSYRHPAEGLNAFQLKAIGFNSRPDWTREWRERPDYTINLANWIWKEWRTFLMEQKYFAAYSLTLARIFGDEAVTAEDIKKRGQEIGVALLAEVEQGLREGRVWAQKAARTAAVIAEAIKEADAKYRAVKTLYSGLARGDYAAAIATLRKELGDEQLQEVLRVFSVPDPPEWVLMARKEAQKAC